MAETISNDRKTILTQMGVPGETAAFLEKIKLPSLQEWAYLCAAEGMMKETLDKLCGMAAENMEGAAEIFMEEREKHLRLKYEDNSALKEQFEKLHSKVESMYKRASFIESSLDETIKKALRDKDELYGKIIESKEEILREKDKQLTSQKEQLKAWEERTHKLEDRLKTLEIKPSVLPDGKQAASAFAEIKDPAGKGAVIADKQAVSLGDRRRSFDRLERGSHYSFRQGGGFFLWRRERSAEKFIRQFMEDSAYSEEQKEFLIRCLEQGDSLEFIKEFASPSLSVEHMAWLRNIIGRRIWYGR